MTIDETQPEADGHAQENGIIDATKSSKKSECTESMMSIEKEKFSESKSTKPEVADASDYINELFSRTES